MNRSCATSLRVVVDDSMIRFRRGGPLMALVVSSAVLVGCSAAGVPETEKPPTPAKFIEGDWQCLTTSEDGNSDNEYTYHLKVTASHISIGTARTGEDLYWTQYDYTLAVNGTLTTVPENGGPGWVIQLPDELSYESVNAARIAEGWAESLEVSVAPDSARWTGQTGLDWDCERGDFEDDGNTFVSAEHSTGN
ncbi:hypothetical protein SRABI121_02836 [Microbacterium sp. Bi121]|nr:hypothetical protein SRABI121_02836 [Microbacterium sp. Bi121]